MSANREAWLLSAVDILRDAIFKPRGIHIPEVRLSVGLPHARNQRDVFVQHHAAENCADQIAQIFVNPTLDSGEIVLAHLHGCLSKVYARRGQKPPFGPSEISLVLEVIGSYPQAALKLPETRKQDTRMLKLGCRRCGYIARATLKWIKASGLPFCSCQLNSLLTDQPARALTRMECLDESYVPF